MTKNYGHIAGIVESGPRSGKSFEISVDGDCVDEVNKLFGRGKSTMTIDGAAVDNFSAAITVHHGRQPIANITYKDGESFVKDEMFIVAINLDMSGLLLQFGIKDGDKLIGRKLSHMGKDMLSVESVEIRLGNNGDSYAEVRVLM